jgi:hypothetical protein
MVLLHTSCALDAARGELHWFQGEMTVAMPVMSWLFRTALFEHEKVPQLSVIVNRHV